MSSPTSSPTPPLRYSRSPSFQQIGSASVLHRMLLVLESCLIMPLSGIVYPLFIVWLTLYHVIVTVVSFSRLEGGQRRIQKRLLLDSYKKGVIKRAYSRSRPNSPEPPPPPAPALGLPKSKSSQLFTPPAQLQTDISEMVVTTSAFLFPPTPVRPHPKEVKSTGGRSASPSPPPPKPPSTFTLLMEDPAYVIDSILSKRRTILTLAVTCLYASRTFLNVMLGATLVKKYLILLSVTLPSIAAQYDLLFTFRSSFSRLAMTSFTIHALTFLVLVLSVCYEVPPPYLYLTTLFDFCYQNIFPVGVIISILEGWRVGSKPAEEFWEDSLKERTLSPPPSPLPPPPPHSDTRSDAATCTSSHQDLHDEVSQQDEDRNDDDDDRHLYHRDEDDFDDDPDRDIPLESVEEVSICASTSSTNKRWNAEDEVDDSGVDDHNDSNNDDAGDPNDPDSPESNNLLKNLNYPMRPVQVDEFLHKQQREQQSKVGGDDLMDNGGT